MEKPDISNLPSEVVAYIHFLENALSEAAPAPATLSRELDEPPTTMHVLTLSRSGMIKRTPRHLYSRQKRGGMGVFELDMAEEDRPQAVAVGDEQDEVIIISNFARIFRLPIAKIAPKEVRAKGEPLRDLVSFHEKETAVAILTGQNQYVAILTEKAFVITRNRHYLKEGAILYDVHQTGRPVSACWSSGQDDLFVATTRGQAIRFSVRQVPTRGCLAIRRDVDDELLTITAVADSDGVLLLGANGQGTIRQMSGFRLNKSPGAGGKVALKTDRLVCAMKVNETDDVFTISSLGKMIRFAAADIPSKAGAVQGVVCMQLRADEVAAVGLAEMSG